jgi:hypothetical protein
VVVVVFELAEVVVAEEEEDEVVVGSTTYTCYVVLLDHVRALHREKKYHQKGVQVRFVW